MAVKQKLRQTGRMMAIAVAVVAITAQHYLTDVSHENMALHNIHYLLYFLPILMGAIWFGLKGGVGVAVLVSLLYSPIVFGQAARDVFGSSTQKILELVIYNLVGLVTGLLSERERREGTSYRMAAEELDRAYTKLREQTDLIIEKEEQLRRAERLSTIGELAAGVAHEIRNPLASIKGTAEILEDTETPDSKRKEFTAVLLKEVDRLNRFVESFLELARFKRLHREKVDFNDFLQRTLQIIDFQVERKGIAVTTSLSSEIPALNLDSSQMEHAVLNLLLNAIGAMSEGGTLTVTTRLQDGNGNTHVVVEIADTGAGIPSEQIGHVFDPFFTTKSAGTGLGLPIVKRIVKAHGGSVDIASETGKGTRATLVLPVDMESEQ